MLLNSIASFSTFYFACSLKDVQIRTDNVNMDEDPSGWRPFKSFVETLREKYTKNEGIQGTIVFLTFV